MKELHQQMWADGMVSMEAMIPSKVWMQFEHAISFTSLHNGHTMEAGHRSKSSVYAKENCRVWSRQAAALERRQL